jgi:hypothetical protein
MKNNCILWLSTVDAPLCTISEESGTRDFVVIYNGCATFTIFGRSGIVDFVAITVDAALFIISERSGIADFIVTLFTVDATLCIIFGRSGIVDFVAKYGRGATLYNIRMVWDSRFSCYLRWMRLLAPYLQGLV